MERMPQDAGKAHPLAVLGVGAAGVIGGIIAPNVLGDGTADAQSNRDAAAEIFGIDTIQEDLCATTVLEVGTAETVDVSDGGDPEIRIVPEFGALKPVLQAGQEMGQATRLWSDSMTNPFTTSPERDPAALHNELVASLCEDPLLADSYAHMFANYQLGEGMRVGELEDAGVEWLAPYVDMDDSEINDHAGEYVNLNGRWDDDPEAVLEANARHRDLANRLATVLERMANLGVHVGDTTLNYHIAEAGVFTDGIPEVEINGHQYSAEALMFVLTNKPGECIAIFGANIGDQRPEMFACDTPDVTTTTVVDVTSTTEEGQPSTTPTTGTTSTPTTPTTGVTSTSTSSTSSSTSTSMVTSTTPTTGVTSTSTSMVTSTTPTTGPTTTGRPVVTAPASTVISGGASGGTAGSGETTTTIAQTTTTEAGTTTTQASSVTNTTLGECGAPCE